MMLVDIPENHAVYIFPVILERSPDDIAEALEIQRERDENIEIGRG